MNSNAKKVVGAALTGLIAVVFLHNPTGGYEGQQTSQPDQIGPQTWDSKRPECANSSLEAWRVLLDQQFNAITNMQRNSSSPELLALAHTANEKVRILRKCVGIVITPMPATDNDFVDWRSRTPIVYWFAPVANVLWAIAGVIAIALVGLFSFASHARPKLDG